MRDRQKGEGLNSTEDGAEIHERGHRNGCRNSRPWSRIPLDNKPLS